MDRTPIFTIGYGNRSLDEFLALLIYHKIYYLVDVRSHPYSQRKPEFTGEALKHQLEQKDIRYVFLGDMLGGRPNNAACYKDGRVDYERCREQLSYQDGIARLRIAWEKNLHVALMCSEGKPEECHRSKLIGTTLNEESIKVMHIDENDALLTQEQVVHRLTQGQLTLFAAPSQFSTSRKRYRPANPRANGNSDT